MHIGQKYLRDQAIELVEEIAASDKASAEFKAAAAKFIETKDNTRENSPAAEALIAELEKAANAGCEKSKKFLLRKITLLRSPYGSSVVTVGHMISDLVVWIMYLHPART